MKTYILNILIAVDCLGNALCGGMPDETISSRAALARRAGKRWGCVLCAWLDRLERNHCELSIVGDDARADAVDKLVDPA